MIKRIFLILLGVILVIVLFNYKIIVYGLEQAKGQLNIVYNAQPISDVLTSNAIPDSIKQKLLLIRDIKKFAEDSLGINKSENYETYYDQKGQPAIWVITGSEPFELKAYEWKFPILGTFSYKGFFNKRSAIKEEKALVDKGYDTDIGTASGWSTLGWFKDPVLSGMLKRKEGSLASLIIHELTHGTLFIKDSVEYNENLANFIGDKGAIRFLEFKYGKNAVQLTDYERGKQDREKYIGHILRGAGKLDSLYSSLENKSSKAYKINKKKALIGKIIQSLDTINFYSESYSSSSFRLDSLNNTFFLGYQRYNRKQDNFEREFKEKFNEDLKKYLRYLKDKYPSL